MNYSKTIREYCNQNKGKIFDVSYERIHHFEMVPYKTLLKILNRLEEEKVIATYSKGIYLINSDEVIKEDPIISYYASEFNGAVVGYDLYNKYEISSHKEKLVIIYTNAMETSTKNIGDDYKLIRFDVIFGKYTTPLIEALEIIENKASIADCDLTKASQVLISLLENYLDSFFEDIIKAHKYKYSTICSLENILRSMNKNNKVIEIFKKNV